MKNILKILAIIVLLIVALILILPFVFKGKVIDMAKKEINRNVEATVDFSDMDLSLIKNFPNFSLGIDKLSVIGENQFQKDTLLFIDHVSVVIDLFSVFGSDGYEVKKILVDSPQVKVKVLADGKANYDIAKPDETITDDQPVEEASGFNLSLRHFQVLNGQISYKDEQTGIKLHINGFDNSLSGDFSDEQTNLRIKTNISSTTFRFGAIDYLSNATISYDAVIDADLKNGIYTLDKNKLMVNALSLAFSGSVSTVQEGLNLVLSFEASNNSFKNILSMVPAVYSRDFENMKADGMLSLDGNIKGIYSETMMPSFNVNIDVRNGQFSYPELPGTVTDITLDANISNPGGEPDNTVMSISQFGVKLGPNPFVATLLVKTPVSDPYVDAKIKGTIDLSTLKDYYPIEEELSGKFITDITLKGNISSIEKERYDEFIALGSVLVQDLNYATATFNEPVSISNAQLNFAPEYLDLVSFKMKIGKSDLSAKGKITNYLAYTFKNGELKGTLDASSTYFNIDELIAEEEIPTQEEDTAQPSGEGGKSETGILEVPDQIDFTLQSSFTSLTYDNIAMKQVRGKIRIKNKVLRLENLRMNVVQGQMTVNGSYSTKNPKVPEVDLNFKLNNLDIPTAYNHFAVMRTYLPLAKKTTGKFSAGFNLTSKLDSQMMPVYETMNGSGSLNTSPLKINDLNTLVQVANVLNYTDLEKLELNQVDASFRFIDGKMNINPFDIRYKNVEATIEGWTGFDQSIGYVMNMKIPREELGAGANQLMENLINEANKLGGDFSLPETIAFDVVIGGTLSNPKIQTGLAESGNNLIEQAKEEIIREVSEEALKKAKEILDEAERQSKAIIAEARKQAQSLKNDADKVVSDLKKEYNKQADSLVALGKKNGFVAELAAKEAARQLKAEADVQAQKLLDEADTQADRLISEAEKLSKSIRDEARKQADALLKPE